MAQQEIVVATWSPDVEAHVFRKGSHYFIVTLRGGPEDESGRSTSAKKGRGRHREVGAESRPLESPSGIGAVAAAERNAL